MIKYLSIIAVALLVIGCKTYSDDDLTSFDQTIQDYVEKNDLKLENSPSGLYYSIINKGEGRAIKYKDSVSFTYKGTLLDGKIIDEQTEPVTFEVSVLIGAWKEMMLMLNKGGKAYLITPPNLAYGGRDLPEIPPHSILIFELEVTDVK